LDLVVQRGLLGDDHRAAYKSTVQTGLFQILEQVGLPAAKVTGNKNAWHVHELVTVRAGETIELYLDPIDDPRLTAAKGAHRIPVRHTIPQRLERPLRHQDIRLFHDESHQSPPPIRTSDARGFTRSRSRTSS